MRATPRGVFLALSAIAGTAFALLTPPLQAPDELRHLMRAYAIADGVWLAETHGRGHKLRIPRSITQMQRRISPDLAFRPEQRQDVARIRAEWDRSLEAESWVRVRPPSLYSPVAYLPQAAAVAVGRSLAAPPVLYVYLGRLANLAMWMAIIAFALQRAPAHRLALCALALAPISVFEAASLSADAATNACALLFMALLLEAMRGDGPIARHTLGMLAGAAAALALTKPVYAFLPGLVVLIPARRFPSGRHRALAVGAVIAAAVVPLAAWSAYAAPVAVSSQVPGSDPAAQFRFVTHQPFAYLGVLFDTWFEQAWGIVETFVGRLGQLDVHMPAAVVAGYALLLLALGVWDGGPESPVRGSARLVLALTAMLGAVVVYTSGYIGWNHPGAPIVAGVQGRYLWPLVPCVLLAIHRPGPRRRPEAVTIGVAGALAAILVVAIGSLVARYYGPA